MAKNGKNVRTIYSEAIELTDPNKRSSFLDKACGNDDSLRQKVEALLGLRENVGDFLESPPFIDQSLTNDLPEENIGTVIGNYKLLKKIGEGGMAVVYSAQQEKPIKRKVAIKIIKLGMDTKQVIGRFDIERQALALMDHQNIAKIHDAGATETGRPYFVMELVEGQSITEYCDKNNLTTKERLDLFISVCNAVQHAHQKGIIHRDIKPTNVLVIVQDGKPVPKVIDFGIAKATGQQLTEKTVFTKFAQMIGTPEYMSPEQAETGGTDIDTRTDIYSLGVLLYEILTSVKPFDAKTLREAGYGEIQRIIREEDPTKPSTRLSTLGETLTGVAQHRKTEPNVLKRLLQGDLDWIVMKALEKNRDRRYETAAEFGADIGRHLSSEPVVAASPTPFYRLNKFIRRNRALVTGVSAVLVVLVGAIVVSSIFAFGQACARKEAEQQTSEARRQERIVEGVNDFLNTHVLGELSPYRARGGEVTVRSALDSASKALEGKFKDEPLIEASIRWSFGKLYKQWGYYDSAELQLKGAWQIQREQSGEDDPDTLSSMLALGCLYLDWGRYDQAEPLLFKTAERRRQLFGAEDLSTLNAMFRLSRVYWYQGCYDKAEPLNLEVLKTSRRCLGAEHPCTILAVLGLGFLYSLQGEYSKSEPLLINALDMSSRIKGEEHAWTQEFTYQLGWLYYLQGRYDEAEPLLLKGLAMCGRIKGQENPEITLSMNALGYLCLEQGRYTEAEDLLTKSLEIGGRGLGKEHPEVLRPMNKLGVLRMRQKRYEEAKEIIIKALAGRRSTLGEDHPDTLESMHYLGVLYRTTGKFDEAKELFLESLEGRQRKLREGHPDTMKTIENLAELYEVWGKPEKAEEWRNKLKKLQDLKE